jgi:tetratricopeptide (TPR) repeat protein
MSNNFHNKSGQGAAPIPAAQAQALAQTLLQQAWAFQQKGQLAEAQTVYESLLKLQPRHFEGLKLFSSLAYQTNKHQLAIDLLARAIEINPKSAALHSNIGLPFQALHRYVEALASHDKAIALEPNFVEAHNNRGNTLKELDRPAEALDSYDKAIALKPDFAPAHNGRGIVLAELKRFDEALDSHDKAIALKSNFAEAHNGRAVVLAELKQLDEALASYDKAIALKPDYAEAYYNRAVTLSDLKQLDEAIASYDKAIALKPYYPEAYCKRGHALQALKRVTAALASYDKAIALKPDYPEAHVSRTHVLEELKHLNATMENAPSSHRAAQAAKTARAAKIPIMPGFERHYLNYHYAPSHFANQNVILIDGHEIRVRDRLAEPEIVVLDNILSDVECELLIDLSRPRLRRTPTFDPKNPTGKGKISSERTSEGMGFLRAENPLIRTLETRIAKLMNVPIENGEELQVLHYATGAEYRPHYDFFPPEDPNSAMYMQRGGQRVATLVLYLNDVEGGGETIFPELDFAVAPSKGGGVYFSYCDDKGTLNRSTLHGGAPVTSGEKWITTKWVRQRAY